MGNVPKFKKEKEEAEFWMRNIFMFAMEEAYAETHPEAEEKEEKNGKTYMMIYLVMRRVLNENNIVRICKPC